MASAADRAAQNFTMPALSPTMTEGNIASWKIKEGDSFSAGDVLLNEAADLGADLIVMGAYGHSRFRELVLGGVTRTLLGQMTVPVLMSH